MRPSGVSFSAVRPPTGSRGGKDSLPGSRRAFALLTWAYHISPLRGHARLTTTHKEATKSGEAPSAAPRRRFNLLKSV